MKQPSTNDLHGLRDQAFLSARTLRNGTPSKEQIEDAGLVLIKLGTRLGQIADEGPPDPVAEQLAVTNGYLSLFSELLQEKKNTPRPFSLPTSVADASELLARWLWLQLPEESKKDLMP